MRKYLGIIAAAAIGLAGCSAATPVAQTVVSPVPTTVQVTKTAVSTGKASTVTETVTSTDTTTVTPEPADDFNPIHVDVRTAASPAFDGWANDVMERVEGMVCKIYTPTSKADAPAKAGLVAGILSQLDVPEDQNVDTFKVIVTNVCPEYLGYLPVF